MATAPDGLSDLVHWLNADDAATIVDAGSDGDVDQWLDMSGAANHASQGTSGSQPQIVSSGINGRTAIGFDGADDRLDVADDATLNTGGPYSGKTLMMAFRTGNDVSGRQVLYEQGGSSRGLNFYVDNGQIYLNGWNLAETAWGPSFANSAVSPNTTYIATFVFDQAAGTVEGFVDGSSIGSVSGVGFLNGHTGDIALGAVNGGTLFHDGTSSTSSNTFSGLIGEFVQYNQALPDVDRAGVEAYLQDRWQGVANQLPTAGDDSGSTTEDSAVTITVLDNDTDSDGGSPTVSGVDTAGTVGSVTNNGSDVTYDPNGGFESLGAGVTATDTFKYTIADGQGGTDTATVTVTVTGLNDAPVAMDDNGSTDKETPFTTANVLTNDSDPDGPSALSVTGFDTTGTLGQVTNNGDGTFDYNPNGQFDGLAGGASATDTFTYMVSDGGTGTDTATVTVTVTSGIPGTAPDSVSDLVLWLDADDGATITDTGNDGDVDLWSDKSGQGNHASETTSGSQPTIDAAGINGRTAIGFDGSNDGLDVADDATLNTGGPYTGKTLMMAFRTGSDVAGRQVLYEQGGQTRGISFYILNGELYLNGWNLAETVWGPSFAKAAVTANTTYIATFVIDQAAGTVEGFLDGASIGSVSGVSFLNSHGQNIGIGAARQDTRFHDGSSSGDDHTFDGRIGEFVQYNKALTDVEQAGVEAYLQSRWQGVANQLPTAGDDSDSTTEDSAVTIAVLANDTDSDGGSPTVSGVNTAGTTGSVTNNGSDVTYDPNGGFENLAAGVTATDTFEYTLADGQGGTDTATVTVTVTGINDAPVASDDSGSTDKETTFTTANVLTNDSDPDGPSALSVTGFDTTGTLGQVTNNGDGTFDYDPNGQFDSLGSGGSATDTFTYTVSDGGTGTDTATVTVTVTGVANQPPDAVDDNAVATEGFSTAGIDVLANDSDPEDGSAVIYVGSDVTGTVGNVTDHGDGTFTYDAQGLFESLSNGATTTDSFTYTIEDSGGLTDTATVTVVVSGDNDQPDAVDDTATVAWDAALGSIDVLVNDSDIDSADTLSVTGFDVTGTLGQVSNNGGGTFSYDPNGAFDGLGAGVSATDTFTYTIGDAQGGSDTATVTVTVNGGTVVAGTAPDSVSDLVQWLDADDGTTITDTGNDGDVDLWSDKSGQGNHASETTSGSQPSIVAGGINGRTAIGFDGSNDGLDVADDATLNTGGPYAGKTLMMAFRTGSDVTGRQVLYEQGGGTRGINFYILNGELYLNGWNLAETVWGPSFAKAAVTANTTYVATFVIDQAAGTVEGFLDGASIGSVSGVSFLNSHGQNIGVGAARQDTRFHDGSDGGDGHTFDGRIGEFAQYNKALTDVERAGVEAYMQSRWQGVANLSPTAGDDSGSTNEDTPTVIDVLANDTDTDGGTPSVQAVDASGTVGSVTNNGSDVTYDPNGGFDSLGAGVTATDTFKYTVADGQGGTDTATVTITVTGINDAPVATDDNGSTDKASSFTTANVLANDSDPDGPNTLSVAGLVNSSVGQVINNGDGTFDYNPNEQFNGLSGGATATDTFTYKVTDGNGGSDTATVTVTITSGTMGTAPGSVSDLVLWLDADDGATITDTGSDGDVDQWSDKSGQGNHASETTSGSQPSIDAGGINGRTAIGFDGSNDGLNVADDATLNTGGPYSGKTLMMAFRTGDDVTGRQVLYEQGGGTRGINFYILNGELYLNGWNLAETVWGPSFAKAAVTANTTYVATFVHDQTAGTVEGFIDGVSIGSVSGVSFLNSHSQNIGVGAARQDTRFHDGSSGGDGHTFDGRIGEFVQYNKALTDVEQSGVEAYLQTRWSNTVNVPPVANDDSVSTGINQAKTISVLDNDTDANFLDILTVTNASGATNGTVSILANTKVTYTPSGGFSGTDTFTYTIDDGHGETDTATVTVSVTATAPPDQFNGLALWLDAADAATITESSGSVSAWQDKSGNGRDYSQAIAASRPTLTASLLNGLAGIQTDGVDDYLEANLTGFSLNGMTLFMVANVDQTDANSGIFNFYDDTALHDTQDEDAFALRSDGDNGGVSLSRRLDGGNPLDLAGLDAGTTPAILVAALAAATGKMEVNGGTDVVDSYGDTDPIDPTDGTLGARWINGAISGTEFGANDFFEILVYDRVMTNTEINDVNNYLSTKWGIVTTQSDVDYEFVPFAGQSNAESHFSTSGGQGINQFLNDLSGFTAADSVTSLNTAVGASAVDRRAVQTTATDNYWWDLDASQPGPLLTAAVADIKAHGVTPTGVVWAQGEQDAKSLAGLVTNPTTTTDRYKQATEDVFDYFRNELGLPDLQFYIQQIGPETRADRHAAHHLIREAQTEMAAALPDVHTAALSYDQDLFDSVHFTGAGYAVFGSRLARYIANEQGETGVTYGSGPTMLSAQGQNGNTEVVVTLQHGGGSDFTPATLIDGFLVEDTLGTVTVNSAARQSATEIILTLNTALSGASQVSYINGVAAWDNTDIVTDNAAPLTLPLAPDSLDILLA